MAFKAGTVSDYSGSMAEAMEEAFRAAWEAYTGTTMTALGQVERRILFSAIAQGVLKHLKDYSSEAFKLKVYVEQDESQANQHKVLSNNESEVDVYDLADNFGGISQKLGKIKWHGISVEQYQDQVGNVHKAEVEEIEVMDLS